MKQVTILECKECGERFSLEKLIEDHEDFWDEVVWGHIQMCHEELFEEVVNLETPDMLEVCYHKTVWNLR